MPIASAQSEIIRKYIQMLTDLLTSEYQHTRQERARLHEQEWETMPEGAGFTVLGLIELYTTYITGYASQIVNKGNVTDLEEATSNLHQYQLLSERNFVGWYFVSLDKYPLLTKYTRDLDYLRLVVMMYIQQYQR